MNGEFENVNIVPPLTSFVPLCRITRKLMAKGDVLVDTFKLESRIHGHNIAETIVEDSMFLTAQDCSCYTK